MKGAERRAINALGDDYDVYNSATGDVRDTTGYNTSGSPDGTVRGVLEQRRMPTTESLSAGEEVESDLEIRIIDDGSVTLREPGDSGGKPSKLQHPDGQTYEVVAIYPEDSDVSVLTVVRD